MRTLEPAPASLYDPNGAPRYGAYRGALPAIDLGPLAARRVDLVTRRKRWFYVAIATDELYLAVAVVHVGYLATAFGFAFDRQAGRVVVDRSVLALPFGQRISDTAGEGCDARFRGLGARVDFRRPVGAAAYELDLAFGDLVVEARLDASAAPPAISVVAPVPGGTLNATEKRVLLAPSGEARIGKRYFRLEGGLAGYDYTHGLLARRTSWKWAFALGRAASGERVALNLVEGFVGEAECAVWVDDRIHPVGEGRFGFDPKNPLEPWTVTTTCGAVDLRFTPGGLHEEDKDFGVVKSRFLQPVGLYQGTIRVPDRAPLRLDGVLGVTEDQDVLW